MSRKHAQDIAFLNRLDRCLRCDEQFRQRDNLGTHECKFYHPGLLEHGMLYTCCQNGRLSRGCCAADHTETFTEICGASKRPFVDANSVTLTADMLAIIAPTSDVQMAIVRRSTWRPGKRPGEWIIARIDFRKRAELLNQLVKPRLLPMPLPVFDHESFVRSLRINARHAPY